MIRQSFVAGGVGIGKVFGGVEGRETGAGIRWNGAQTGVPRLRTTGSNGSLECLLRALGLVGGLVFDHAIVWVWNIYFQTN